MDNVNNQVDMEQLKAQFFDGVTKGDFEKIIGALEQGVDINSLTPNGNNALFIAANRRQKEVFNWLLEVTQKGKSINLDNRNIYGHTLVYECIKQIDMEYYLEKLVLAGADVNIPDDSGLTPLIRACSEQKINELEILLKSKKIRVNATVPLTGTTALLMAAAQNNIIMVQKLVEAGAHLKAFDTDGKNALLNTLMKEQRFLKKFEKKGHALLGKYLIEASTKEELDYIAPTGLSAMWAAALTSQDEFTKLMLEKGANPNVIHEYNLNGKTSALNMWLLSNKPEIVTLMLEKGADINFKDDKGNSASSYGFIYPELHELMLKYNADVNAVYYEKQDNKKISIPVSTFVISQGDKCIDTLKEMVARGMKVTFNNKEMQAYEPLFLAVSTNALDIAKTLIDTGKIDLNRHLQLDPKGQSMSLISFLVSGINNKNYSAVLSQKQAMESLLKVNEQNKKIGAGNKIIDEKKINEIKNSINKINEYEVETELKRIDLFNLLLDKGAKVNNPNELGNTEIFFAKDPAYASLLMNNNANIFHENNDGQDVLYYSILNNKKNVISHWKNEFINANHNTVNNILYQLAFEDFTNNVYKQKAVQQGIINYLDNEDVKKLFNPKVKPEDKSTVNIKELAYIDEDGNSPLLVACANNNIFLTNMYIKLGADVNLSNEMGETPLMHAINTENTMLIDLLLNNNADVRAVTKEGKSILEMAEEIDNTSILTKIKERLELIQPPEVAPKTLRL